MIRTVRKVRFYDPANHKPMVSRNRGQTRCCEVFSEPGGGRVARPNANGDWHEEAAEQNCNWLRKEIRLARAPGFVPHWRRKTRLARKGINQQSIPQLRRRRTFLVNAGRPTAGIRLQVPQTGLSNRFGPVCGRTSQARSERMGPASIGTVQAL